MEEMRATDENDEAYKKVPSKTNRIKTAEEIKGIDCPAVNYALFEWSCIGCIIFFGPAGAPLKHAGDPMHHLMSERHQ